MKTGWVGHTNTDTPIGVHVGRVRSFEKGDIDEVERLYRTVFCQGATQPSEGLKAYLNQVFLENPWYDESVPPLVYENDDKIVGFLGVIPRQMVMKGKPVKVAVGSQFMVDPDSRNTLAGVKLLQTLFSGPHELSMTDGANALARRLWETLGGASVPIYSIYWTRTLSPREYARGLFENRRNACRSAIMSAGPLWQAVELLTGARERYRFRRPLPFLAEEGVDENQMCDHLTKLSMVSSLRPLYDPHSLKWLLQVAAQKSKFGPLHNEVLRNADGEIVGWYLYYLNADGVSQVLQIAASPKTISSVLDHLFYSAWRRGSTAIAGRMEPRYMHELYHQHCQFTCGSAFLIHSKDPEILQAIYTGEAFLTRLEGEWWNCFNEFVQ